MEKKYRWSDELINVPGLRCYSGQCLEYQKICSCTKDASNENFCDGKNFFFPIFDCKP